MWTEPQKLDEITFGGSVFFHGERFSVFSAFRPQEICRERQKMLIVGRRNAEIAEKCSSSVDETQKTLKNARRRPTKRWKREKVPVVGRRNAENAEKQSFVPLRRAENTENRVS